VQDNTGIAKNIQDQARFARALFIWTDCDREGEHIGSEVRDQAVKANTRIEIKRARFSNTERACVAPIFLFRALKRDIDG
jgi:DNA topoisomerase III